MNSVHTKSTTYNIVLRPTYRASDQSFSSHVISNTRTIRLIRLTVVGVLLSSGIFLDKQHSIMILFAFAIS